jgi:hypothetical protein
VRNADGLEVYVMCGIPGSAMGIDSLSLNPDSLVRTIPGIVEAEQRAGRRQA